MSQRHSQRPAVSRTCAPFAVPLPLAQVTIGYKSLHSIQADFEKGSSHHLYSGIPGGNLERKADRVCIRTIRSSALTVFASFVVVGVVVQAQVVSNRITAEINSQLIAPLPGSKNPHAATQNDVGRVRTGARLSGVKIYFRPF